FVPAPQTRTPGSRQRRSSTGWLCDSWLVLLVGLQERDARRPGVMHEKEDRQQAPRAASAGNGSLRGVSRPARRSAPVHRRDAPDGGLSEGRDGGTLLFFRDGGASFVPVAAPTTRDLRGVSVSSNGDGAEVYAVGAGGTILHADGASGGGVTLFTLPSQHDVNAVWASAPFNAYAAVDNQPGFTPVRPQTQVTCVFLPPFVAQAPRAPCLFFDESSAILSGCLRAVGLLVRPGARSAWRGPLPGPAGAGRAGVQGRALRGGGAVLQGRLRAAPAPGAAAEPGQ